MKKRIAASALLALSLGGSACSKASNPGSLDVPASEDVATSDVATSDVATPDVATSDGAPASAAEPDGSGAISEDGSSAGASSADPSSTEAHAAQAGSGDVDPGLEGTRWELADAVADSAVFITFSDGRLSGSSGVNRFSAPCRYASGVLECELRTSTMMAGPPELMAQEHAVFAKLDAATGYRVGDGTLVLVDADGATLLSLIRSAPPSLVGPTWSAVAVHHGKGGVASLVQGTSINISFDGQGRVSGFGGCNSFGGTFEHTGDSLSLGPLRMTRKACGAPGVMEQENALSTALSKVSSYTLEPGSLVLRSDTGATLVRLRAE